MNSFKVKILMCIHAQIYQKLLKSQSNNSFKCLLLVLQFGEL